MGIWKIDNIMMKFRTALILGMCLFASKFSPSYAANATMSAGVNLSGLEFNSATLPGKVNYNYVSPSDTELAYYESKGILMIRLPVLWARLQPKLLAASPSLALDPGYLALIKNIIAKAAARKMTVIVDIHNYGGYATHKIGDGVLTQAQFANFWSLLAANLKDLPGLGGYDLMNEPSNMPSASIWPAAAQAAVTAIRTVDSRSYIFVEGDDYASAGNWNSINENLNIKDPRSRVIYEAHVYGDHDSSGTHFDWTTEESYGVTVETIAQRVKVFTNWCNSKNRLCVIGEVGVGNDNAQWNEELANGLAAMKTGGILGFTYWAGGPWWGSYPMSIEPTDGVNATQMSVVFQYAQ